MLLFLSITIFEFEFSPSLPLFLLPFFFLQSLLLSPTLSPSFLFCFCLSCSHLLCISPCCVDCLSVPVCSFVSKSVVYRSLCAALWVKVLTLCVCGCSFSGCCSTTRLGTSCCWPALHYRTTWRSSSIFWTSSRLRTSSEWMCWWTEMFLTSVSLLFFLPVCLPLSQCVWVSGWLGPVCVGTALMIGLCVCVEISFCLIWLKAHMVVPHK